MLEFAFACSSIVLPKPCQLYAAEPLDRTSLRDDRFLVGVLALARLAAGSLNGLDNLHSLLIRDFAKDDVLAVQP